MYNVLRASAKRATSSSSVCAIRHSAVTKNAARKSISQGSNSAAHATSRRYAATAVAAATDRRRPSSSSGSSSTMVYLDDAEDFGSRRTSSRASSSSSYPPLPKSFSRTKADPTPIVEHLQELLPGLDVPPEIAVQMLTHASAKEAWAASNTRLSFVGRRVISTYLLLFLHHATTRLSSSSSSRLLTPSSQFDFDAINYRATFTPLIGERVGRAWDLQRSMLWTPPVSLSRTNSPLSREDRIGSISSGKAPGLYKVQGTTVEAIMGGLYHQFGGLTTQRVFHTRFLPHIFCPGEPVGLHDAFHGAAREMMERMGGPNGSFSPGGSKSTSTMDSKLIAEQSPNIGAVRVESQL